MQSSRELRSDKIKLELNWKPSLLICVILVLAFSPARSSAETQNQPHITYSLTVTNVDLQNQTLSIRLVVNATNVNWTQPYEIVALEGDGVSTVTLNEISKGYYLGNTPTLIQWPLESADPQDYPYNSYISQFTLIYPPIANFSNPLFANITFGGTNNPSLKNEWGYVVTNNYSNSTLYHYQSISLQKNTEWPNIIEYPIWFAFAILGACLFLRPRNLSGRLTVLTSLFVFAPIFLFTIQPLIPARGVTSLAENQLLFLIVAVGIVTTATLIEQQINNDIRQLLIDVVAVFVSEVFLITQIPSSNQSIDEVSNSWNMVLIVFFAVGFLAALARLFILRRLRIATERMIDTEA